MARRVLFVLVLLAYATVLPAAAQRYDDSDTDRFSLRIGSYNVRDSSTRVRVDSSGGVVGTVLDFEDTLDVDSTADVTRLDGYYRFNPRHRLEFSYFKVDRDGTATLLEDVEFGDEVFATGARVETNIENEVFKLSYSYSFIHQSQYEFGIGAGLHVASKELGMELSSSAQEERVDGTAPLPVFGFRGRYDLTPKLSVQGKYDIFIVDTDNYDGTFSDFMLSLEHQTTRNVGLGVGFNRVNFDFEADDGEFRGEIESSNNGWLVFVMVGF